MRRGRLDAQQVELEAMFRRLRVVEINLGIPGQGPRPDDPERESNRHMRARLVAFAKEIRDRLDVVDGKMTERMEAS